jgi:multidrug efflux pump subunit AcrA (membrane-fusion protein)
MAGKSEEIRAELPSNMVEVVPVESPSENSLVAEHLQKMPSLFSRGLIYVIVIMLAVSVAFSLVGKMDIVVECPAVARPVSHEMRVLSDRTGYLENVFVAEGQEVAKGAPLFHIRSRERLQQRAEVDRIKLAQTRSALNSLLSDMAFWKKEVQRISQELKDLEGLYQNGIVSGKEVTDARSRLEKAQTELTKLGAQRDISQNEIKILEKQISEDVSESEKTILAEGAGVILELFFRNKGDYIRESDLLCTIVPADAPLYVDVRVANKDIAFIEKDMTIKFKFDAFPYREYGSLKGRVSSISAAAIEDKALGYVYQVQGALDIAFYDIKGKHYEVKPGMTAVAELVTERKTIFSMLFKKFRGS